jgi:ankyrin repeat protein
VNALLGAGAAVNQAQVNGTTPLIVAAQQDNLKIVNVLLRAGAAVNQALADGAISSLRRRSERPSRGLEDTASSGSRGN